MVNEGTSNIIWKSKGTIRRKIVATEVDPWFLINMALGSPEEIKAFWKSLNDTRDIFLEINDIVTYKLLKDLSNKNALKPEQIKEFDNLDYLLPHLIQSIENAKIGKRLDTEAATRAEKTATTMNGAAIPHSSRRDSNYKDRNNWTEG